MSVFIVLPEQAAQWQGCALGIIGSSFLQLAFNFYLLRVFGLHDLVKGNRGTGGFLGPK